MWIKNVLPERIADLFHNYEQALEVCCARWSEGGSQVGPQQPTNKSVGARAGCESVESRKYFAQPGEAEWGC